MSVVDLTSGLTYASLSAAITASAANDVVQISAGSYVENFPNITHDLTIESTGGLAYLSNPQPDPPNGRAVINVPFEADVNLTLIGLDISGAQDDPSNPPDQGGANGAGNLYEIGNGTLDVENCHIHNNEDGILTGGPDSASLNGMVVTINNSEIDNNGVAPTNPRFGFDHNIYAGALTQLTVTNSYIHDALGGHEIKSRALASTIENNRIQDNSAPASYQIDLPDGGADVVENNVLQKGENSPQEHFVDFGAEPNYPGNTLNLSDNTFINQSTLDAIGLLNATRDPLTGTIDTADLTNDLFYGLTNVSQDLNGPPDDQVTGAQFFALGAAPSLDTLSPFAATTEAQLNDALTGFNGWVTPGSYTLDISGTITESSDLVAIGNANAGVALVIDGYGGTVDAAATYRGLAVDAGTVILTNLTVAHAAAAYGGLVIGGGGLVQLEDGADPGPITFAGAGDLQIDAAAPGDVIAGLQAGDTIDLASLAFQAGAVATVSGTTLAVASDGATVDLNVTGLADGRSFFTTEDAGTGTELVACFVAGTRIATASGPVAVEDLCIGDFVMTAGGVARPVQWIGRRHYPAATVRGNPQLRPVLIRANAIAPGIPDRDLRVSATHAVYLDGALVPAAALANGVSIRRERHGGAISYFHIELEGHDVIFAEGLAVETFIDDGSRRLFDPHVLATPFQSA